MQTWVFVESAVLLLVLLNPFLLCIYLLDLIQELDVRRFGRVLVRASVISGVVFTAFAWAGDALFSRVLQVRFCAFQIFGGIVFLVIAIRFVLMGGRAITSLRGSAEHLAGAIAMPFMIGPGTVSASVLAGTRLPMALAALAVCAALSITVLTVLALKTVHDVVRTQNEPLVDRYVEIVGRISALVIGTIAVEMVLQGFDSWLATRG
jgi:small neutral amino acid transporter SnatA (MarC family)